MFGRRSHQGKQAKARTGGRVLVGFLMLSCLKFVEKDAWNVLHHIVFRADYWRRCGMRRLLCNGCFRWLEMVSARTRPSEPRFECKSGGRRGCQTPHARFFSRNVQNPPTFAARKTFPRYLLSAWVVSWVRPQWKMHFIFVRRAVLFGGGSERRCGHLPWDFHKNEGLFGLQWPYFLVGDIASLL